MKKGILLVVSAPSAGGKGTILKELFQQNETLRMSVSATTRQPRPGEVDGKDYYFVSRETFQLWVDTGSMLEWLNQGLDVVLEIDVQGGSQIKNLAPDCVSVFITPPTMEVLEKRLRDRGTEDEETICKRLATARQELTFAEGYDYIVINDKLEDAVEDMQAILRSEKRKSARNPGFIQRVLNI